MTHCKFPTMSCFITHPHSSSQRNKPRNLRKVSIWLIGSKFACIFACDGSCSCQLWEAQKLTHIYFERWNKLIKQTFLLQISLDTLYISIISKDKWKSKQKDESYMKKVIFLWIMWKWLWNVELTCFVEFLSPRDDFFPTLGENDNTCYLWRLYVEWSLQIEW